MARLDEDVMKIRELYATGQFSQRELADMFAASPMYLTSSIGDGVGYRSFRVTAALRAILTRPTLLCPAFAIAAATRFDLPSRISAR
jgi:hypothetical protein